MEIYEVESEKELNWLRISAHQTLSEKFIIKHSDKVDWYWIPRFHNLSEDFIEKNSDKVDWYCVSKYQKLSEPFIERNSDKLNWMYVLMNQIFSKEFIEKHWETIPVLSAVRNCGNQKRIIYRLKDSPNLIKIGCFKGTKEEAIEAIKKKYKDNSVAMQHYIKKVELCFNTTLID